MAGIKIRVECYAGYRGDETPRRIFFHERSVEVIDIIDQWIGEDHRYFKVKGSDQTTYILRQDVPSHSWEMTMYQAPASSSERSL